MNRTTTVIAAVVVVAIVVIAAAAVLIRNGGDDSDPHASIASELQIMGNANDDYTIDDRDMQIVDDIIAGNSTLVDYPLADVNNDGVVDQADKTLLQRIINREAGTSIYVLCLDTSGNNTVVECTYPLRNVVTYATNMQVPVLYANGGQYIAGYFSSNYDVAEGSISSSAVDFGGSSRSISDAVWMNFTTTAANTPSGIGAFMTDYSAVAQLTSARQADLAAAGIPLIIYPSADATDEITTVLTVGFLFGGECETVAVEYAQKSWDVLKEIEDRTSGLSDDDRTSYICLTMWTYVCQNDSTYNTSPAAAGGIPYYRVNSDFAAAYTGSGSSRMSSVDALSNYTDVDLIISNRSLDYGLDSQGMTDTIIEGWEHESSNHAVSEYFYGMEDKLVYVNNLLPGAAKLAYMAVALYGDTFSEGWADGILQDFIDMGIGPLVGQTLDSIPAYITYEDYQAAKA